MRGIGEEEYSPPRGGFVEFFVVGAKSGGAVMMAWFMSIDSDALFVLDGRHA